MGLYLIAEFSWLSLETWLAILKVALGLGAVIFVHELGHFVVAKLCGVKCEKFYIGFDFFDIKIGSRVIIPRALAKFRWGETEYGIGIVPLGGYVKMLGQDDNPANAQQEAERTRLRKGQDSQVASTSAALPAAAPPAREDEYVLDPRSYKAKPVWQRMAIISAGVIMNLIFAVIFAAIAYRVGVEYQPAVIGATVPGGPAWMHRLEHGDRIVQISRSGESSRHLRFDWDLQNMVGLSGTERELELLIRSQDGSERWISVRPTDELYFGRKLPSIGIVGLHTNEFVTNAYEDSDAKKQRSKRKSDSKNTASDTRKLQPGDVIVAVNGQPVQHAAAIRRFFERHPDEVLTLTVERVAKEKESESKRRLEIPLEPVPMRHLGLVMRMGPIKAVQPGSPADHAGLKAGDVLLQVDGEPVGDPLLLPQQLQARVGEQLELLVRRAQKGAEAEEVTITIEPQFSKHYAFAGEMAKTVAVDVFGIVYAVEPEVQEVRPGSPAAKAGMRPGDTVVQVRLVAPEKATELERDWMESVNEELAKDFSWPVVHGYSQQHLPKGTRLELKYRREGLQDAEIVTLTPEVLPGHFLSERGLVLAPQEEIRTAGNWQDALSLGVRQTKEDMGKVLLMLRKLVTREVSVTNLGGPGTIAYVATSEASAGTSRLLIFLTFLSANLAILNFLPIPVLDGGHMLFLAAEAVRGRPLDEKWEIRLTLVGFAFILCLMIFVISMDVMRFSGLM